MNIISSAKQDNKTNDDNDDDDDEGKFMLPLQEQCRQESLVFK